MLRYGKEFTLTQELLDMIATYMNDDIRERLHCEIAPFAAPDEQTSFVPTR